MKKSYLLNALLGAHSSANDASWNLFLQQGAYGVVENAI